MHGVRTYETALLVELLRVLRESGASIYGTQDGNRLHERVPTVCFNLPNVQPSRVTEAMAEAGIGVRDGHMYAPRLMRRLGVNPESGVVRISLVHYNTVEEIQLFQDVLLSLSRHA
jgi:selenocysteine lyase/cysteine desulfurase